jgi:two-component system sensor histidine kinase MtrB
VIDFGKYEFYVLEGLSQQESTLNLIGRSLSLAGILLIILIGLITGGVLRRLIQPVREAARIAEELTAGDLNQRMNVRGTDEVARLGYAFNEMAVALKQQISRLENLSRLQQRFVSDVSHELRTPLTTIRMASQVIYGVKENFDNVTARSAELLLSQIDRFESLLIDLLEVSRFDAQAAVMEIEEIDLVSLVRESIDYVHPSQERVINLMAPKGTVMVDVDKRRIQRILRNLVTNAIDHREEKPIDVTIAQTENVVAVGVRDYGVGFSSRDRASLFDRFWRADPSRARTRGGPGLGLSIAMEDAKLHQGLLEAWGQPKRGANFVLTLPIFSGGSVDAHPISVVPRGERLTETELGENQIS